MGLSRSRIGAVGAVALLLLVGCQDSSADGSPSAEAPSEPATETPREEPSEDEDDGEREDPDEEGREDESEDEGGAGDPEPQPTVTETPPGPEPQPTRTPIPQPDHSIEPPPAPETPSPSPTEEESPDPGEPDEVGGPSGPVRFGEPYAWENGLTVTTSRPTVLESGQAEEASPEQSSSVDPVSSTPSPTDSPTAGGEDLVAVDVTVVNNTGEVVHPIYFAMKSGGSEAREHTGGGYGVPNTTIAPGESASFSLAFTVADASRLELTVWPTYHYQPAHFVHHATSG